MSNYTPVNDYSAKDALSSGDPSKKILGSEIDAELAAIQTAIATKADDNAVVHDTGTETVAGDKTFSGNNTHSGTNTFTAGPTIQSTDAGASFGPTLTLDRNSASPAVNDVLGQVLFYGRDSGGGSDPYAVVEAAILDPTAASEDGQLAVKTLVAGVSTSVVTVRSGVQVGAPTGGDIADAVNAEGLYQNNVQVATLSGTETLTNKTVTSPVIGTGISQGSGFKHGQAAITVAGAATESKTINWAEAFADNNYSVCVSVANSGGFLTVGSMTTKNASQIIVNVTNSNTTSENGTLYVIAVHN